ncbi:MAG: c-type cytochrome [Yoonia sp.]|uniref:c-type cytochrome n=1 Tax=Yoonia sp. TaxID=2212373 RepID=UPI003EF0A1EF
MKSLTLLASAAVLSIGTLALADGHTDANPAVKARQSHMQLYSFNLGILGSMAQGKVDYDAAVAQNAADNLAAISSMDETNYWVEGTALDTTDGTKAQPAIWENMDDFLAKQDGIAEASAAMAAVAGTDLASLQGAMGDLGGTCSACHREYRAR